MDLLCVVCTAVYFGDVRRRSLRRPTQNIASGSPTKCGAWQPQRRFVSA